MLSNSIENITEDYEFLHKRKAYYNIVRDAAEKEIKNNIDTPHRAWKAQEAFDNATASLEHIKFEEEKINSYTKTNGKYIQSLCSLTFDNDKSSENTIEKVVEKFTRMLDGTRKEPIWKTLTPEGIEPSDEDKEWFELLFKREVNPEYTLNYKVSQLDTLHTDAKRIASSCTIQVQDLSTRVRFTYADSPDEPMANTYVFYWMYGEGDLKDKLATAPSDLKFFNETNSMLPLGIGLTDENGYLVKSAQMGGEMDDYQELDLQNATFEVKPGFIYGGWDMESIIKDAGFRNGSAVIADVETYRKKRKNLNLPWNQWLNTTEYEGKLQRYNVVEQLGDQARSLPVLTAQSRILHSYYRHNYYIEQADKSIKRLARSDRAQFNKVSNQYFFPDREYGFFAYPVNRGNFKTTNLLKLAEGDAAVAWKGMVPIAADENEQPIAIQLHCALPEWDRRITAKLDILNMALHKAAEKVKAHTINLEHLAEMNRLVDLQQNFPYELRDQGQVDIGVDLKNKINKLSQAIHEELKGDKEESVFISISDIDEINEAADVLKTLIFNEAFLKELKNYVVFIKDKNGTLENDEGGHHAGPYMEKEPFWGHILDTLIQCITSLSKTYLSKDLWREWVEPMFDAVSDDPEVLELIEKLGKDFSEFESLGKVIHDEQGRTEEQLKDEPIPEPIQGYIGALQYDLEFVKDNIHTTEQDRSGEPYTIDGENPLIWVVKSYKKVAGALFHRVPGAPSIVQQMLDLYGESISKKMMKKGSLFHIKINVALFRLCGVEKLNGAELPNLPKSLVNKVAITGYIAQSSVEKQKLYIKRLRLVEGVRQNKVDFQFRKSLEYIAVKAHGGKIDLSDKIYDVNINKWYKTLMFGSTAAFNIFTLVNLGEELKGKSAYEQTLKITSAAADILYTASLAKGYIAAMQGIKVSEVLPAAAKASLLGGEAAARYVAVIAVLVSIHAADKANEAGKTGEANLELATAINTLHVQLAYAAKTSVGRSVLTNFATKTAAKSGAARVMAWGLGALLVPIAGEFALITASIISAGLIVTDIVRTTHTASKSGLNRLFHAYEDEISKSKVALLDKHCHELYSKHLKNDAQALFDDIKDVSDAWFPEYDSLKFGHLCWRAVVPLHLRGFSTQLIESLVKLPRTLTETTRSQHRSTATNYYSTVESAQDIITFYQELLDADASEVMPSGRKKYEIAAALTRGNYMPAQGKSEELTIKREYDREQVLSFDHLYFRQPPTELGLDWDALNAESHELFQSDRT
jgi:hypothetical protein